MKKVLAVFAASIWISFSEFLRNQILLKDFWEQQYASLGLSFPFDSIHGMIWGVWSALFAYIIFSLQVKFTTKETLLISWLTGFVMMWLVIGNLGVLPYKTLLYAIPLSVLECFFAILIIKKITQIK